MPNSSTSDPQTLQRINPQEPPSAGPLPCPRCGNIETPTQGPGSGPHAASLRCAHCRHFLCWASRKSPAARQQARVEAMAHRPATQRQLTYLVSLGDQDTPPGSMLEASQRIGALVHGEVA